MRERRQEELAFVDVCLLRVDVMSEAVGLYPFAKVERIVYNTGVHSAMTRERL